MSTSSPRDKGERGPNNDSIRPSGDPAGLRATPHVSMARRAFSSSHRLNFASLPSPLLLPPLQISFGPSTELSTMVRKEALDFPSSRRGLLFASADFLVPALCQATSAHVEHADVHHGCARRLWPLLPTFPRSGATTPLTLSRPQIPRGS